MKLKHIFDDVKAYPSNCSNFIRTYSFIFEAWQVRWFLCETPFEPMQRLRSEMQTQLFNSPISSQIPSFPPNSYT